MLKFEDIIKQISDDFTEAWNQWDIEKLMTFLTDDVIVYSPKVSVVYPLNEENIIVGKENVKQYWSTLVTITGKFNVIPISIEKKDREVKTTDIIVETGQTIISRFTVNEYGKIDRLNFEYI